MSADPQLGILGHHRLSQLTLLSVLVTLSHIDPILFDSHF